MIVLQNLGSGEYEVAITTGLLGKKWDLTMLAR